MSEIRFASVMEFCETDLDFILKQYKVLPEREARLIIIQVGVGDNFERNRWCVH